MSDVFTTEHIVEAVKALAKSTKAARAAATK